MLQCPQKNSKEWKDLVDNLGEDYSMIAYIRNNYEIPNIETAIELLGLSNEIYKKEINPNEISYQLKTINILQSDKAKQIFTKGEKAKWSIDKILQELAIPKEQKQLVIDSYNEGNKTPEQLAIDIASKYSYSVEVKTATNEVEYSKENIHEDMWGVYYDWIEQTGKEPHGEGTLEEFKDLYDSGRLNRKQVPTQHYSNLTVPGGTNYTENRIITPQIVPSIKGHAQFAEKEDIGWFRSDDKVDNGEYIKDEDYIEDFPFGDEYNPKGKTIGEPTKTRRILELQSDLFQKGRDKNRIVSGYDISYSIDGILSKKDLKTAIEELQLIKEGKYSSNIYPFNNKWKVVFANNDIKDVSKEEAVKFVEKLINDSNKYYNINEEIYSKNNNFLQLLNKDNNWVTFFIKSIIQDSAKKGYEKVLFPKGETAAKIEGHETIADEIRKIDEQRELILSKSPSVYNKKENYYIIGRDMTGIVTTEQEALEYIEEEKANLKSQGIEKLKPIEAFYEIKVGNILEKQFGKDNIKTITDEFSNQWREIDLSNEKVKLQTEEILLKQIQSISKLKVENLFADDIEWIEWVVPEGTSSATELINKVLNNISKDSPQYKLLEKFKGINIDIILDDKFEEGEEKTYAYIQGRKEIHFSKERLNENDDINFFIGTLIHELIHAATIGEIKNKDSKFSKLVSKEFDKFKERSNLAGEYGLTNELEFIAELFSDNNFANKLFESESSLFRKILNSILEFLGFNNGEYKSLEDLYNSELYKLTEELILKKANEGLKLESKIQQGYISPEIKGEGIYDLGNLNEFNKTLTKEEKDAMKKVGKTSNSKLFKQLLNEIGNYSTAFKRFLSLQTDSFKEWYGKGQLDEEFNPIVNEGITINDKGDSITIVNNEPEIFNFSLLDETSVFYTNKPVKHNSKMAIMPSFNGNKGYYNTKLNDFQKKVVNKYFRYKTNNGISVPYESYTTGLKTNDFALINRINNNFLNSIVEYDNLNKVIKFIDNAEYVLLADKDRDLDFEIEKKVAEKKLNEFKSKQEPSYLKVEDQNEINKYTIKINDLKQRVSYLQKKRTESDKESRAKITANIKLLEDQILQLETEQDEVSLSKVAGYQLNHFNTILDNIEKNIQNDMSDEDVLKLMREVYDIGIFTKTWEDLNSVIKPNTSDTLAVYTKGILMDKLDSINQRYLILLKDLFKKYASKNTFKVTITDDIFDNLKDTDLGTRLFQGLGVSKDELLQITDDIIQKALFDINNSFIDKENNINNHIEKLKDFAKSNNISIDKVYEYFLQKDDKGNLTGNLIGKYTQEYWNIINTLRDEAEELEKKGKSKSQAWKKYYQFRKDNSYLITIKEIDNNDTTRFTQEEIDKQKELIEDYNLEYEAQKQSYIDSGMEESEINDRLMKFESEYSPYTYINSEGKDAKKSKGKFVLFEKPIEKWKDNRFIDIENNTTLKEFYKFMTNTFYDNNKLIPLNFFDVPRNYLPELRQTMVEQFHSKGFFDVVKGVPDFMKIALSEEIEETIDSRIRLSGKEINFIPIRTMSNTLSPLEKSYDLEKILKTHTATALNYYHKSRIEVLTNAATEFVNNANEVNELETNTFKKDKFGNVLKLGKNLNNTKKHLEYAIMAYLYDKRRNKNEIFLGKTFDKKAKQEFEDKTGVSYKNYKEYLQDLKFQLDNDELVKEEYDRLVEQAKSIGRNITVSSIGDNIIKLTYLKALSLPNFISPVVNSIYGKLTNMVHASAGKDFTIKDLFKADKIILTSITQKFSKEFNKENSEKLFEWMRFMKLLDGINEQDTKSWIDKLTILQQKAEYFNQGEVLVAMLLNKKLNDKNNKEVSLWDAYKVENNKLVWNTELMGEEKISDPTTIISKEGGVNLFRLNQNVSKVVKFLHGDYKSPLEAKKSIIGRSLMLFRTWLPMSIQERFGKEYFDKDLGKIKKGRIRSIFNPKTNTGEELGFSGTLTILRKIITMQQSPIYKVKLVNSETKEIKFETISAKDINQLNEIINSKYQGFELRNQYQIGWDSLSEIDKDNLRRDLAELSTVAILSLVGMLLKAAAGDDDEDKELYNLMINTLSKTSNDLMFFYSPNAMSKLMNNAVPIYRTVKDLIDIIPITMQTISGEAYIENGIWKDRLKLEKWFYTNTPGLSGANKIYNLSDRIMNYN